MSTRSSNSEHSLRHGESPLACARPRIWGSLVCRKSNRSANVGLSAKGSSHNRRSDETRAWVASDDKQSGVTQLSQRGSSDPGSQDPASMIADRSAAKVSGCAAAVRFMQSSINRDTVGTSRIAIVHRRLIIGGNPVQGNCRFLKAIFPRIKPGGHGFPIPRFPAVFIRPYPW